MTTTIDTTPERMSTRTVTSADRTAIVFERMGAGPPLVLVVGAFCDRSSAESLAGGLADTFTVYRYDRRGRGDSGNTAPYSVQREVEDLAAVIEAAGEPAFVFGHSSGGSLALEAAGAGVPIRALVVHEPPYTDGPTDEFAEQLEKLVANGHASDAAAAFLELLGTPPAVIEQMQAGPHWAHMVAFAPSLSYEVRLCNNGVLPADRLANVLAPALALAGQNSPPWAHQGAQAIAQTLPNGDARVLEDQGHAVADEVLIPVLKEFLRMTQRKNATDAPAAEIDGYLRGVDEPKREVLQALRGMILEIVPDAEEGISYGVPAFRVHGKIVAGFAAFKSHLSYLPFSGSVLGQFEDDLRGYQMTKSSLHFPADHPLPKALVKKLLTARLDEILRRSQ